MSRHPILAGILLALFLFASIVCTTATVFLPTVAQTLNIGASPNRVWTPPATTTPTATPSPTKTSAAAPVTIPANLPTPIPGNWTFKPGDTAQIVNNGPVNMRRTPGYKNKAANDRIALAPPGAQVSIITGPARADNLIWWYVAWNGEQGWMAERQASGAPLLGKK